MHPRNQERFKFKKKIKLNSLQAAICNVALFKNMKDKEFRDTIFITYCEDGVILEALNEGEWKRANDYILNFLNHKKISMLTYGYDREEYQSLIGKGLKDITRLIKERDEECPYINIIHYQKLRKSCEFMDKEKYVQPLKDWESKNKRNPKFAFLIVEPAYKFDEVKRGLLEFLVAKPVPLNYKYVNPIYFLYLFHFSASKEKLKDAFTHKLIEVNPVDLHEGQGTHGFDERAVSPNERAVIPNDATIKITNFTSLDLNEFSYTILPSNKNINKSGLEYLSEEQLQNEAKHARNYNKINLEQMLSKYLAAIKLKNFKEDSKKSQQLTIVPYRREEEDKYQSLIRKYLALSVSLPHEEMLNRLETYVVCELSDIEIIGLMFSTPHYTASKVCINDCPFMAIEYPGAKIQLDSFLIYLQQLKCYYCSYMVRFYGISVQYRYEPPKQNKSKDKPKKNNKNLVLTSSMRKQVQKVVLIVDYHRNNLEDMLHNDLILDNMQIATMVLQILYFVNFLYVHQQPRCLGPISISQIFWPMQVLLPYLGVYDDSQNFSVEADIKNVSEILKQLLGDEADEDLDPILTIMNPSKHEMISLSKCILSLQEILNN